MAKQLFSFILLYFFTFSFSQNVNIPDSEFKFFLANITPEKYMAIDLNGNYTKIDTNGDGEIQVSEAENITSLYSNNLLVKNITGLEAFKNLNTFSFISNVILSLDLSSVKSLKNITITNCLALSSLNLKGLANLEKIDITGSYNNYLSYIDFSENVNLKKIYWNGKFSSINISNNINLEEITLLSQNLSSLNISTNTKLKKLVLDKDKVQTLDFSSNIDLETIYFSNSSLLEANFINNSNLKDISIYGTKLNLLILPQTSNLKNLSLSGSKVQTINFNNQLLLEHIVLTKNTLAAIDFSKNINLSFVQVSNESSIKSLDLSMNSKLQTLWFDYLDSLESLYIKNNKKQNFSESYNSCPKLNFVCCDEDEKDFFINKGIPNVTTDCLLKIQENNLLSDFKIYPNPTSGVLNFSQKVNDIKIFDLDGKLIFNKNINSNILDVSTIKNGVYILDITSDNKKTSQKFIKK